MTDHTFEPGDIAQEGNNEVHVERVHGDTVSVRQWSGLAYEVPKGRLRPVFVTTKHVGQWARITDQSRNPRYHGCRGVVEKVRDGWYVILRDTEGCPVSADPGCAVLVARPTVQSHRR